MALGYHAGYAVGGQNQQRDSNIEIGNADDFFDNNSVRSVDVQTATFIVGIRGASAPPLGRRVLIDSTGRLRLLMWGYSSSEEGLGEGLGALAEIG